MKKVYICIVLICVTVCVCLAIPAAAILGEPLFVKWKIDNPYVNDNYSGWNEVYIEGFDTFLIPQNWSLQETDDVFLIIDDIGDIWAYGTSDIAGYEDLLATIYNVSSVEIEIDPFSQFLMMNGSDVDLLQVQEDISESRHFSMQMFESAQKQIVWILVPDIIQDETQYDIAEAIVYSFAFKVGE